MSDLTVTTKKELAISTPEMKNWQVTTKEFYTCDEVIDAYIMGKTEGIKQFQMILYEKLVENVNKSSDDIKEIFKYLEKNKFHPQIALLKIISYNELSVIITLPEKELFSNNSYSIYNYISEFESRVKKDTYDLKISITEDENIDNHCLKSDGFIYKHLISKIDKTSRAQRTSV